MDGGVYRLLEKNKDYIYQVAYIGYFGNRYMVREIPKDVLRKYRGVEDWFTKSSKIYLNLR